MSALAGLFPRFDDGSEARMTVLASEEELSRLDGVLGRPLPTPLRALLKEVGAGLYEGGHEIFGPSRLMVHDIELVPDLLSLRARLAAEGVLDPRFVPFHRAGATIHLIRTDGDGGPGVVSLPPGRVWTDFASFVEQVLLRGRIGPE